MGQLSRHISLIIVLAPSIAGCVSEEAGTASPAPLQDRSAWTSTVRSLRASDGSLEVELEGQAGLRLERVSSISRGPSAFTWHGRGAEDSDVHVVLTRNGEALVGTLRSHGVSFRLVPTLDGRLLFAPSEDGEQKEIEPLIDDTLMNDTLERQGLPLDPQPFSAEMDVMVIYTNAAMQAAAPWWDPDDRRYIVAEIQQAIDESNSILERSGIVHRLRLRIAIWFGHAEFGDLDQELPWFADQIERSETVLGRWRDAYDPDISSLWLADGGDGCGKAYRMTRTSQAFARRAVNVFDRDCNGRWTFTHEIGHNLGAQHDLYVAPEAVTPYAHGYTDQENNLYTVMSYSDDCRDHSPWYEELFNPCERVPIFSSPDVYWDGSAMGTREHEDNARLLQMTGITASTFSDWPGWM